MKLVEGSQSGDGLTRQYCRWDSENRLASEILFVVDGANDRRLSGDGRDLVTKILVANRRGIVVKQIQVVNNTTLSITVAKETDWGEIERRMNPASYPGRPKTKKRERG